MKFQFPKGFLWGTATSAHQVEGGNIHNDWWNFELMGCLNKCRVSDVACNHYKLFDEDFQRAQDLNNNAHRFSIEWSRVEPQEGIFDEEALRHYRDVFISLKKHGLKPMVTLHHFTLPLWLAKIGGWESSRSVYYFERYVRTIVELFHEHTDMWITFNEVSVFLYRGYVTADWPPGRRGLIPLMRAFWNVLKAHKRAYRAIHQIYRSHRTVCHVAVAANIQKLQSHSCLIVDTFMTKLVDFLWNKMMFYFSHGYHDFIGVNYYQRLVICFQWKYPFYQVITENRSVSDLGWEIYPEGLHEVLLDVWKRYKLPIFITENGIADKNDMLRVKFLMAHLIELHEAICDGVKVMGYYHWSLLDNFEWDLGFEPRFGLYSVDYMTQERRLKESGMVYAEIAKNNGISEHLIKKYAIELMHSSVERICER